MSLQFISEQLAVAGVRHRVVEAAAPKKSATRGLANTTDFDTKELAVIKKIAKLLGTSWQTLAAQPARARKLIVEFKQTGTVSEAVVTAPAKKSGADKAFYFAVVGNKRSKTASAWGMDTAADAKWKVGNVGLGGTPGDFRGAASKKMTQAEFAAMFTKQYGFDVHFVDATK